MVNVADTTISFKVEEELREKAQELIRTSGMTAKDWFQKAIALTEMQSIKAGATDYASDLSELEVHTTRIYELVGNVVQRSIYLKDHAVNDLAIKLDQQREITTEFQTKIKEAVEEKDQANEELQEAKKEQVVLEKQLEELRKELETNRLLVAEYKEKNDTLTGLVTKYEGYATENEQLKNKLEEERNLHRLEAESLTKQNQEQKVQIKDLEQQINVLEESHKTAMERLNERRDVEQEKALLALERQHQKALMDANAEYSNGLKGLYDDMATQRRQYDQKIAELEQRLNSPRQKSTKTSNKQS